MSFLSGLSNIFHGIGHVLAGNDDEEQKKKQQQAAQPVVIKPTVNPAQNNIAQATQAQQAQNQSANLNITPLQKIVPKNPLQANPTPDALSSLGPDAHTGPTDWKGVGRGYLAAPVSTALDVAKGVTGLVDMLPGKGENRLSKVIDKGNTGLSKFVGNGAGAQDALQLAKVAALPATLVGPGEVTGAIRGAEGASDAVKAARAVEAAHAAAGTSRLVTGAQKTAGFFSDIPVLAKAVANKVIAPQDADTATRVAPGIHTVNPNRPTDAAKQLGMPVDEAPPAGPAVPTPSGPAESAPVVPEQVTTPPAPVEAPATPAKPAKPAKPGTTTANAPGIRAAAQKKLDSLAGNAGDPTTHDILSNKDLLAAGKAHTDTFNDTQLVNHFKPGYNPADAGEIAQGHAALQRLNEIAKADPTNKDAAKAIDNILAGAEQGISKGGRTVNYAKEFYDGLQGPAKTNYLIRQIDKVREAAGKPLLRDDEAAMKAATEKVQSHVTAEEASKAKIATLEQRLEDIKAEAQAGKGSKQLTNEANVINGAIKDHKLAMSKNTAELTKYYDSVAPLKQGAQSKVGDLARSLMLSSAAGRGNDIVTTGINSAHQLLQQTVEAAAGKLTKKPGTVIDTLPSPKAVARGMKYGLKKSAERFKGNVAAGEASALLKKVDTGSGKGQLLSRTDGTRLSKIVAPVHRVVRSATEVATDLSEGIKEARVQQLAAKEGKMLGLKGHDLKSYAAATTASPSKVMEDAGKQLRDEVNNMQDNQLSDALDKIGKGFGHIPIVGEQLRNLTIPFTRWTGGAIHNAVMDKNAVANIAQLAKAARKGDQQGMITAVSKLAVNGVASIGAGYTLAKAGLITHENAQGYNDDGVYLHIGGRYIPAGFLGFFAPGLIMGSAAHDAMSKTSADGKHGSILSQVLDGTGKALVNSEKALGAESLTGENNPVIKALQDANKNGYGNVGIVAGGQVAGSYIPALGGDANAILNNGIPGIKGSDRLNPTHEAALTKVEKGASGALTKTGKPSTAKNVTKTVENQLLNKIPGLSQQLPRNKGVAANDEFDRLTRGNRDTQTEIKARADAKTAAAATADLKVRDIPDPSATYKQGDSFDNAVENRIENKNYDAASEGLKLKLKQLQSSHDVTTKQTDPIKKQLAVVQVLKEGNYDPKIRDNYSHTSLSEWRDLGDPTSDNYDKARYEELYNFDKSLADKGVSSSSKDGNTPKYSLKDTSKSTAKKAARSAQAKITSNKLGNTPNLPTIDLSNLSPQKISTVAKIPTIQQIQSGELIKKRAISVSKATG